MRSSLYYHYIVRQVALHMYDHMHGSIPPALNICIQPVNAIQLTRRQRLNIANPPLCRTNYAKHSLACEAPKVWTIVPPVIRDIACRSGFAKAIKRHLVLEIDVEYHI